MQSIAIDMFNEGDIFAILYKFITGVSKKAIPGSIFFIIHFGASKFWERA